jgi:hypothetical protein
MRTVCRLALVPVLLVTALSSVTAKVKLQSSWAAEDLAPIANPKVLVLAQVQDEATRRTLEDAVVHELKLKKAEAIPAYSNLSPADTANEAALRAKARELGVNAGLLLKGTGVQTVAQATPSVSVGVGIPVNVGMFSVFVGGSVPVGGGTKTVQIGGIKADFYQAEVNGPRWTGVYSIPLEKGAEASASELAAVTVKQLRRVKALD